MNNIEQHRVAIGVYNLNLGCKGGTQPRCRYKILNFAFLLFLHSFLIMSLNLLKSVNYGTKITIKFATASHRTILFLTLCYYYFKSASYLFLCGDVQLNPGPTPYNHFIFSHWNVNSLQAHDYHRVSLLESYSNIHNCDIIGVSETALRSNIPNDKIDILGYTAVRNDLSGNDTHGGVLVYHKSDLATKCRTELQLNSNTIVLELCISKKTIFYILIYRKFGQTLEEFNTFIDNFEEILQKIRGENPFCIIISGDFNAHLENWWKGDKSDTFGVDFQNLFNLNGLTQIVNGPTYITNNTKTCIDLVAINQPNLVISNEIHPSLHPNCHHQVNFTQLSIKCPSPPPFKRRVWHYSRANTDAIKNSLIEYDWDRSLSNLDHSPDEQVEHLDEVIMNVATNFIPFDDKIFKPKDPPWITNISKLSYRRYRSKFKKFLKNGCPETLKIEIDKLKSDHSSLVEFEKEKYMRSLGEAVSSPQLGPKKYWSAMKKLLNTNLTSIIPPILQNGNFISNAADKCKVFNDYFSEQCKIISTPSTIPDNIDKLTGLTLNEVNFTEKVIFDHICKLNINKAHGHDGISVRIIKLCGISICKPLCIIFKNCISKGYFPKKWKKANVIPIHKKNEKNLSANYRPVSLLPICGKIFEKVIFDNLYFYIFKNNLISDKQSGYRRGDSTVKQLLSITHEIYKAFDSKHAVRAIFLDISKAFDRVWHAGLIHKLQKNGIDGDMLNILSNFLSDRKQRVTIDGQFSAWANIEAGVPQGSLLGPLLFLIYIDDLINVVDSDIRIFADDTFIFKIVIDENSSGELNRDLWNINDWATKWKMSFNPDIKKQAVEVIFSDKRRKLVFTPLLFNNIPVKTVSETKHLGMVLDSKLSFDSHMNEKLTKANQGLGIMKHLKKWVPHNTLEVIYKMYVRPHLDYGDIVYDSSDACNTPNSIAKKVENIQYGAAKIILGAWHGTSREKLYDILGWESLLDRRKLRKLCLLYEIENNMSPNYLQVTLDAQKYSENSRFFNKGIFKEIICNNKKFKLSFFPSVIKDWNSLDAAIKQSKSKNIFKNRLLNKIRPKKKIYFGISSNQKVSFITMLRTGLSPLRSHKFRHNFLDTSDPYCPNCGNVEDPRHFLLHCTSYTSSRTALLQNVSALLKFNISSLSDQKIIKIFLYGDDKLNFEENTMILNEVIKFITTTGRFVND